ncbi:hypothetical protein ACFQ7W_05410 [Streptomyces niveus]|uniref:hypothetical protein n=1 Tax=Streptomyces niveus TaxID=193462 RepID=UPI0036BF97EF
MSEITAGLYGHEYDEIRRRLEDLVRAAERDAAEKLYGEYRQQPELELGVRLGLNKAAELTFPNYPEEDGE